MDASSAVQFGSLLREARRQKGLSQVELGAGKYSGSYISHLESGRRTATPEVMEFLSHRLGVSLLEWGLAPAEAPMFVGSTIEDLLVAERARSEHDWTAAMEHASQAASRAEVIGDAGRHWEALYVVAQAKFASGEFGEAAGLAASLSEHEIARQLPVARAQALSLTSVANRASDRLGWAIAFGARAVEAASSAPPIVLSEALMALVSAMTEAGHPVDESRPYMDRLAELSPRLTSDHSKGMIAWTLGTAAFMAGDTEAGKTHHACAARQLDPRRDARLWLRFHRSAARCLLDAGIVEGVPELVRTAAVGLEILGNRHDVAELRQLEAKLAIEEGKPQEAARIITELHADPVLGAADVTRAGSEELLGEALLAMGDTTAAIAQFEIAARQFEAEGRLKAALESWRKCADLFAAGGSLTGA